MNVYVLKFGGGGSIIDTGNEHKLPWLSYRRFGINGPSYQQFLDRVCDLAADNRFILVFGGVGAFLFVNLASELSLEKDDVNLVGCEVTNLTASIALNYLQRKGAAVSPTLFLPSEDIAATLLEYEIVIVKACLGFASTDALAAYYASIAKANKLIFFKKNVPEYHVGFEKPTIVNAIQVNKLLNIAKSFDERPGNNSILDSQSLEYIQSNSICASICNIDNVSDLEAILSGSFPEIMMTKVLL